MNKEIDRRDGKKAQGNKLVNANTNINATASPNAIRGQGRQPNAVCLLETMLERDVVPLTPERYGCSHRCSYRVRRGMAMAPVVVVHCEGVICDFVRDFWGDRETSCYFAPKLGQGLRRLSRANQTVLVSRLSEEKLGNVVATLKSKGVSFDAVYRYTHALPQHVYSQLIQDFHIDSGPKQQQRLLVFALGLECRSCVRCNWPITRSVRVFKSSSLWNVLLSVRPRSTVPAWRFWRVPCPSQPFPCLCFCPIPNASARGLRSHLILPPKSSKPWRRSAPAAGKMEAKRDPELKITRDI